jgi:hypothetical protein
LTTLLVALLVLNPIIGALGMLVVSTGLGLLTTWFWFRKNAAMKERDRIAVEHEKLLERISQIELQSHVLAQAMIPVSAAFQAILIKELTHMHTPEMDALLVKLGPPFELTEDEADRLSILLERRTRDIGAEISASERDAAAMLPALIRRVRTESDQMKDIPQIKIIALTAVTETLGGKQKATSIQVAPS